MAISRPLLIALVAAVVLFAAVTAVRVLGPGGPGGADPSQSASTSAPSVSGSPATRSTGTQSGKAPGSTPDRAGSGASRDAAPTRPSRGAADARDPSGRRPAGVPARVARALADRRVVVLFFGVQGHDDRATRRATQAVRGKAAVFIGSVYHLDEYARIVGALPITQVPATVVIDRQRRARVVEGFADAGTLEQLVADAR